MSKYSNQSRPFETDIELSGIGGIVPFAIHSSSSRQAMSTNHIGQALVTTANTTRRIITGANYRFAETTFSHRMPADGIVKAIINKFEVNNVSNNLVDKNPRTIIVFESMHESGERYYDVLDMSRYSRMHPEYGFEFVYNEDLLMNLAPGSMIQKDTLFAKSPNVTDDGDYKHGFEVNVAMMSHPAGIEDGFMISDEIAERINVAAFGSRSINIGRDSYLLDIYGDDNHVQLFPGIGQEVNKDRVIFASRKYNEAMAIVDMAPARRGRLPATRVINPLFDESTYVPAGAKVIDVTVYKTEANHSMMPKPMMEYLDYWHNLNTHFYKSIINAYYRIRHEIGGDPNISPEFETLIHEAMTFTVGPSRQNKIVRKAFGRPLDEYFVQLTYQYNYKPIVGSKFAGFSGDKGVNVRIEKKENMPVDADGNRADFVVDDFSTIKRMNLGRAFEQEIGACCVKTERVLREIVEKEGYEKAWQYLKRFYEVAAPGMLKKALKGGIEKWYKEHIDHVLRDKICLDLPPNHEKEDTAILEDLVREFPPCFGPITYRDIAGNVVTTKQPILIGPMYFQILEKTADTVMAVSSGKYQHFGILSTPSYTDVELSPYKEKPVRSAGESEIRLLLSVLEPAAVNELVEQTNNPLSHRYIVNKIHTEENPAAIDRVMSHDDIKVANAKPLQYAMHNFNCFGFDVVDDK